MFYERQIGADIYELLSLTKSNVISWNPYCVGSDFTMYSTVYDRVQYLFWKDDCGDIYCRANDGTFESERHSSPILKSSTYAVFEELDCIISYAASKKERPFKRTFATLL